MTDPKLALPAALKHLLSFAALLYVAGFLAVRARLSFFGVHAGLPLADQLYLQYGGSFLLTTLFATFAAGTSRELAVPYPPKLLGHLVPGMCMVLRGVKTSPCIAAW